MSLEWISECGLTSRYFAEPTQCQVQSYLQNENPTVAPNASDKHSELNGKIQSVLNQLRSTDEEAQNVTKDLLATETKSANFREQCLELDKEYEMCKHDAAKQEADVMELNRIKQQLTVALRQAGLVVNCTVRRVLGDVPNGDFYLQNITTALSKGPVKQRQM